MARRSEAVPEMETALSAVGAAGLLASEFDHDIDGYQLPYVVSRAAFAWLQAANISTAAYLGLTVHDRPSVGAGTSADRVGKRAGIGGATGRAHHRIALEERRPCQRAGERNDLSRSRRPCRDGLDLAAADSGRARQNRRFL
jgi:hypothetical protein